MTIHRTALFVGAFLAAAGTVMLVGLGDAAASGAVGQAVRLWPIALIALGVALLLRRSQAALVGILAAATLSGIVAGGAAVAAPRIGSFCSADEPGAIETRRGTFDGRSTVDLAIDCGDMVVTTIDGVDWRLDTRTLRAGGPTVIEEPNRLVVRSAGEWHGGPLVDPDDWQLALPTGVLVDLAADINAGNGRLHLAGARLGTLTVDVSAGEADLDLGSAVVERIDLAVRAGSATVLLPERGTLTGHLEVSAGSLTICIPDGLGVRIHGDVEFGDATFNGLIRAGEAWESPTFSTARHQAELTVSARAGSVVVDPAGGCQ